MSCQSAVTLLNNKLLLKNIIPVKICYRTSSSSMYSCAAADQERERERDSVVQHQHKAVAMMAFPAKRRRTSFIFEKKKIFFCPNMNSGDRKIIHLPTHTSQQPASWRRSNTNVLMLYRGRVAFFCCPLHLAKPC